MKQTLSRIVKILSLLLFFNILFLLQHYTICQAETDNTKAAQIDIKDGEYFIDVTLEGGSGRASISSPSKLIVKDSFSYALIEWSSSNYDYMKIGDEIFKPVNTEGNSVFEIPVTAFDEQMPVIADTTAMSMPHEISYTLTFHMNSIKKESDANSTITTVIIIICCFVLIAFAGAMIHRKKK